VRRAPHKSTAAARPLRSPGPPLPSLITPGRGPCRGGPCRGGPCRGGPCRGGPGRGGSCAHCTHTHRPPAPARV
jgi:hypothetical protein